MGWQELSRNVYITGQSASGGAGNVAKTPVLDMNGFESVCFIAVATATNTSNRLAMRSGTASASGNLSDATGDVEHTVTGALYLDHFRPTKRYVQGRFSASGATSPHVGLVALMYGARSAPTTQPAETTGVRIYSAGSGTASG